MITEDQLEEQCIEWFKGLGWDCELGYEIAPDSKNPERESYQEVVLKNRLREALLTINKTIPSFIIEEAITTLLHLDSPILEVNNRQFHRYVTDGIPVEFERKGRIVGDFVKVIDFENIRDNDFLVVNQFTVQGKSEKRRPDIVAFINGLPVCVLELKNPADEDADIWKAFEQIQTYKEEITDLFSYNLACILSDGVTARIGSVTAGKERFNYWRTLKTEEDRPKFDFELETLVKGFFEIELLLDYMRYFVIFEEDSHSIVKKIAAYHQFHAVRKAVQRSVVATRDIKDGKCGVVWHTQGSGKSISMVCFTAKLMADQRMNNPTIVVVTDRNNLDGQLYQTFCKSEELLKESPQQAETRVQLRELLKRPSGGIIFTTIQKFSLMDNEESFPELSDRENIIVISDEAHRSQYGFKAKVKKEDGKITYGNAKHLRDALPKANFIGFTGTPISQVERDTVAVFGDYISVYDVEQAVQDEATVPIYYESKLANLHLQVDEDIMDQEIDEIIEEAKNPSNTYANEQKKKWAALEKLITAKPRLKKVSANLIDHWEKRLDTISGKAMIVCISREACVQMYDALTALRPDWKGSLDSKGRPNIEDGVIRVVMTGSASDKKELRAHVYDKTAKKTLEKRYKDEKDPLKIVIVCDMWLTGFDAPVMHTMYIDKPMRGHNLMQAIARVNRIFGNKPGGLIVDYIGITSELKEALNVYTQSKGRGEPAIDIYEALSVLEGKINHARDCLEGVDYSGFKNSKKIFSLIAKCCDHILAKEDGSKVFCDVVLQITKANALCGTLSEALSFREEIAFFQAIKVALTKRENVNRNLSDEKVQQAMREVLSQSLASDKVVDIFQVAGLERPDVSIFSEAFLEEVRNVEQKNVALEILKRLLKDELKSKAKRNLIQSKKYSELLKKALQKYQSKAIETAHLIEEMIQMAKDFKKDLERGQNLGLNNDEMAFYDALADNESAVRNLGDEALKKIACELTKQLKESVVIDWAKRESIRAGIRTKIRVLLRKYNYPPDKRESAVKLVLEQAETTSESWTS